MHAARSPAVRRLLAEAIDYAGLFPPASLSMSRTVADYADYHEGPDAWALGRLIVPAARLPEFRDAVGAAGVGDDAASWRLSATLAQDWDAGLKAVAEHNTKRIGPVDALEARLPSPDAAAELNQAAGGTLTCFGEVSIGADVPEFLSAAADAGIFAKIRMGGVTPDLIPSTDQVTHFLTGVARLRLPYKATAGLHHPVRGRFPLTYDVRSPSATMFGFLNLLAATALVLSGGDSGSVVSVLESDRPMTSVDDDALVLDGGHRVGSTEIETLRATFRGFGSCSFREPIDELLPAL